MSIFERAPSCPSSEFTSCGDSIPFCCQTGTTCVPLTTDNSSVLCCPPEAGNHCTKINPVTCDSSTQNQTSHPGNLLFTHNFSGSLPTCAGKCCPLGYICESGSCLQSSGVAARTATASSMTSTSTSTSTSAITTSATKSTSSATKASLAASKAHPSGSHISATAIIIGLISGLLVGALITFGVIWLLRRRNKKRRLASDQTDLYHNRGQPFISEPISTTPFGVARTDFSSGTNTTKGTPGGASTNPVTPKSAESKRRSTPYGSPSRYGLPINPQQPTPRRPDPPTNQDRPSYEEMAELDGNRGLHPALRQANPVQPRVKDDDPVPGVQRSNSDGSYITTGSHNTTRASSETISVRLMPPPLALGRGPSQRQRNAVLSTNTTFSQMMEKARTRGRGNSTPGYRGY